MSKSLSCSQCGFLLPPIAPGESKVKCSNCGKSFTVRRQSPSVPDQGDTGQVATSQALSKPKSGPPANAPWSGNASPPVTPEPRNPDSTASQPTAKGSNDSQRPENASAPIDLYDFSDVSSDDSYTDDSDSDDSYGSDSYSDDNYTGDSYSDDNYVGDSYGGDSYGDDSYGDDSYGGDGEAWPEPTQPTALPPRRASASAKAKAKANTGSSSKSISDKPRQKNGKKSRNDSGPQKWRKSWLFIAVSGAVAVVLIGVGLLWNLMGGDSRTDNSEAAAAAAEGQGFAVVKVADPKWKRTLSDGAPLLVPAPAWIEAKAATIPYRPTEGDTQQFPQAPPGISGPEIWEPMWQERDIPVLQPPVPAQVQPLAWAVEKYFTSNYGEPMDVTFSGPASRMMILPKPTSTGEGARAVYSYEKQIDPKTEKETYVEHPRAGLDVIDIMTGESVARYHWRIPLHNKPCLSDDGQRIVSVQPKLPNLDAIETEHFGLEPAPNNNCLAVFSPEKKNPDRWIDVSGSMYWMGFVGPRDLAVLTLEANNVANVNFLNVDTGEVVWSHAFQPGEFIPFVNGIQNDYFYDRETPFNRVLPSIGRINPTGSLLALMGAKGPFLIDIDQRQIIGQISLIANKLATDPRIHTGYMMFTSDGQYLWCLVSDVLEQRRLHDGKLVRFTNTYMGLATDLVESPVPGTVLYRTAWELKRPTSERPFEQMWLVETGTGTCVTTFPFAIISQSGQQQLVTTPKSLAPDFAKKVPRLETLNILEASLKKPELIKLLLGPWGEVDWLTSERIHKMDVDTFVIHNQPVADLIRPYAHESFAERPTVPTLDLKQTPVLADRPANWNPPPSEPFEPISRWDGSSSPQHLLPGRPVAFGLKECACLDYRFKYDNDLTQAPLYRQRHEVLWIRSDLTTGAPIGDPIPLWPWQHNQHPGPIHNMNLAESEAETRIATQVAALRPDGQQLAICDIDEFNRIDIFDTTGKRLSGFSVGSTRIQAAFWSSNDRLWIQSGTNWVVIDPQTQQPVATRTGAYATLHEFVPGRSWFVAWAGTHAELIDCQTGACLNRLECGELPNGIATISVSPNQTQVLAGFSGRSSTCQREGAFTGVVWDLSKQGAARMFPIGRKDSTRLHASQWLDNELVLTLFSNPEEYHMMGQVLDLKLAECTAEIKDVLLRTTPPCFQRSPDGRLWVRMFPTGAQKAAFAEVVVSGATATSDNFLCAKDREIFEPRNWPVQVRVRLTDPVESEAIATAIAAEFAKRGYEIGVDGWIFTCEGESAAMIQRVAANESVFMPDAGIKMVLTDPSGEKFWSNDDNVYLQLIGYSLNKSKQTPELERRMAARLARRSVQILTNDQLPKDHQEIAFHLVNEVELDRELRIGESRLLLPTISSTVDHLPVSVAP